LSVATTSSKFPSNKDEQKSTQTSVAEMPLDLASILNEKKPMFLACQEIAQNGVDLKARSLCTVLQML
jgi:hypothetical protein